MFAEDAPDHVNVEGHETGREGQGLAPEGNSSLSWLPDSSMVWKGLRLVIIWGGDNTFSVAL